MTPPGLGVRNAGEGAVRCATLKRTGLFTESRQM